MGIICAVLKRESFIRACEGELHRQENHEEKENCQLLFQSCTLSYSNVSMQVPLACGRHLTLLRFELAVNV